MGDRRMVNIPPMSKGDEKKQGQHKRSHDRRRQRHGAFVSRPWIAHTMVGYAVRDQGSK